MSDDDGGPDGEGRLLDDGPDDGDVPTGSAAFADTVAPTRPATPPRVPAATHLPSRRRRFGRTVKLAVAVQRYGADISGGAELHALRRRDAGAPAPRQVLTTAPTTTSERTTRGHRDDQRRPGALPGRAGAIRRLRPAIDRCSSGATRSPTRSRGRSETHQLGDRLRRPASEVTFPFFSYRYYHAYGARRAASDPGADRRARRRPRPVDLRAGVPGRPGPDLLARGVSSGVSATRHARRRRRHRLRCARPRPIAPRRVRRPARS